MVTRMARTGRGVSDGEDAKQLYNHNRRRSHSCAGSIGSATSGPYGRKSQTPYPLLSSLAPVLFSTDQTSLSGVKLSKAVIVAILFAELAADDLTGAYNSDRTRSQLLIP